IAPAVSHNAPTFDLIENYMFGKEWVLATYKHPALTNWILESSRYLTGAVIWPAYLISQLFVGATFCFAFLLGRALIGPIRGAAGTLLLAGVTFCTQSCRPDFCSARPQHGSYMMGALAAYC